MTSSIEQLEKVIDVLNGKPATLKQIVEHFAGIPFAEISFYSLGDDFQCKLSIEDAPFAYGVGPRIIDAARDMCLDLGEHMGKNNTSSDAWDWEL